jgi:uncharacterized membrane protein YagU involved in acid resistance
VSTSRALLLGTLTVGTLDILDAIVFFGIRSHAAPIRIFQSIDAGLLGRAAFSGGLRTAILGAALHYFIAFMIVATFFVLSRYVSVVRARPILCGLLYGIAVYLFMNFVVLPLSNAGRGAMVWPVVTNGVLIHMFGVGLPAAWSRVAIPHPSSLILNHSSSNPRIADR